MRTHRIIIIIGAALAVAACNAGKKTTASTPPPATAPVVTTAPKSDNYLFNVSDDGVNEPVAAQLTAIQAKFRDATMEQLKEGYLLYSKTECVRCHQPENIYNILASDWPDILDNMAQKADITAAQKEAVNRYVLSVKAGKL